MYACTFFCNSPDGLIWLNAFIALLSTLLVQMRPLLHFLQFTWLCNEPLNAGRTYLARCSDLLSTLLLLPLFFLSPNCCCSLLDCSMLFSLVAQFFACGQLFFLWGNFLQCCLNSPELLVARLGEQLEPMVSCNLGKLSLKLIVAAVSV